MSFLAPLYALGFLAIAAPIWFHLIRRKPKGQMPFSSLMFLTPSPPPPSQRRRLDQILLLLLRIGALLLLAFAFMRPFMRVEATDSARESGERVLILVDTSASMRRGEVWSKAIAQAEESLNSLRPTDRVGLYTFDRSLKPILSLDEGGQLDATQRIAVARDRLQSLKPSWDDTELGQALIEGVALILADSGSDKKAASVGKIILISDLPQGVKLTGLNAFEWPKDVELELRTIPEEAGNAGLDFLPIRPDADKTTEANILRVRVVNDSQSKQEQYRLSWVGAAHMNVDAYVPPGESRVVKVPKPPANLKAPVLKLTGDPYDFDNSHYFTPAIQQQSTVYYLGTDPADDATGLRYFLERAWNETPERKVVVQAHKPSDALKANELRALPLVVVNGDLPPELTESLEKYLRDGGTVLSVLTQAGPAKSLSQWLGLPGLEAKEAPADRYAMLKDITFDHPLFAPLAGPQFGDFTKVHFWKHRQLSTTQPEGTRVLARFDNGDPALFEKQLGRGRLLVMTSGWQPADSQLARSSKFVPMMASLIEMRGGQPIANKHLHVHDRIPLTADETLTGVTIRKPDGISTSIPAGTSSFEGTDQPGIYTLETSTGPRSFAVNLDPSESLTAPLPIETLEQFGCKIAKKGTQEQQHEYERQQRDIELERKQSIWRFLILAAMFALLVETALAGRRIRSTPQEDTTS